MASYDKALAIRPDYAAAHNNRGSALKDLKRHDEALASYDQALAIRPDYAEAHNNRGSALRGLRRYDEALASYERALAIRPDYPEAHNNRGNALKDLKRHDEALASYDRALAIRPDYAVAHNNRGSALRGLKRHDEALASYDRALAIRPDYAEAYNHRGNALKDLKRLDEALASYDQALAIRPDYAEANWNKSLLLLLMGTYLEGWKLYEWRLKKDDLKGKHYHFQKPSWRGQEDLRGKTILVYREQGLGDVIQFCRYLPLVAELAAELIVEVPKSLLGLVSSLNCPMTLVAKGETLPEFAAYCPMISLPSVFKTTLETIPSPPPYLHAAPDKVRAWNAKLGERRIPRIGLAWSGSAKHRNDHNRSLGLEQLRDLLALPDIEWHSLQKEYRRIDLDYLNAHPELRQHQDELGDFSDTAALIECMDLVISVDTSVAHVAGAIGKPTWILLPHAPDYRWLLERSDSPWYPTAKLYRQPEFDDWKRVLTAVKNDLANFQA